jgi:hypothetical protein
MAAQFHGVSEQAKASKHRLDDARRYSRKADIVGRFTSRGTQLNVCSKQSLCVLSNVVICASWRNTFKKRKTAKRGHDIHA